MNTHRQTRSSSRSKEGETLTRPPIGRMAEKTMSTPPKKRRAGETKSSKSQEPVYPDVRMLHQLNGNLNDPNDIDTGANEPNRKPFSEPEHLTDEYKEFDENGEFNEYENDEFNEKLVKPEVRSFRYLESDQLDEKVSLKPPSATRKWQPSKTIKQPEKIPSPKLLPSYTLLYVSIAILCAVVSALLGFAFYPKVSEMISKAAPPPPQKDVAEIIAILKSEFGEQPPMTFNIVKGALRRVTEPDPKEPAIIMLFVEQGAEDVANRFARKLADSVPHHDSIISISGHKYLDEDSDVAKKDIDNVLNEKLREDQLSVVFVERLDNIPADAALIFHTYCDHENAPFKHVVYVMTVASEKTDLKSLEPKEWDVMLQEHLYKSWSTAGTDQTSSLLSRLTVSVAAIVPAAP